jgi:hypothetical protein
MTVGVADDTARLEGRGPEGRLLPPFPPRGGERGLSRFDLAARELPEAAQQPLDRTSLDEPGSPMLDRDDRGLDVRSSSPAATSRKGARVPQFAPRPAGEPHRTRAARRCDRPADRLAELHHRLGEPSRPFDRQQALEGRPQPGPDRGGAKVALFPGPPGRDPEAVRLERDLPRVEGEARDGPRDVGADSGERLELGHGARQLPVERIPDLLGGPVEVSRPGVVPRTLPRLQHLGRGRAGEGVDCREPPHEPVEIRLRLRYPRLLEQHLRDPDPVRVAVVAPGERSSVGPEPTQQRCGQRRWNARRAATAHGHPREEQSA